MQLAKVIAAELKLKDSQTFNALKLLFEGECTIPFVARYRKEMTGGMDEVVLRALRDRYSYLTELNASKVKYIKVVEELCAKEPSLHAKLPELRAKFLACTTKQELEDLYLPFKPKRRTKAQVAKERGLEPLLDEIMSQLATIESLEQLALKYVTPKDRDIHEGLRIADPAQALEGAADILAERISETAEYRACIRRLSFETGVLASKRPDKLDLEEQEPTTTRKMVDPKMKKSVDYAKYENYWDYKEPINAAAAHRIMAVRRGEAEKALKVTIEVDTDRIEAEMINLVIGARGTEHATAPAKAWIAKVVIDSYRRLISPSIETEIRMHLKTRAEEEAIRVFSTNLKNKLLLPPLPKNIVMGVDPGLRTGSKIAIVSETGKLLAHETIYPDYNREDSPKTIEAKAKVAELIRTHNAQCVAIGNGTGSREIDRLITGVLRAEKLDHVKRAVVNEAGASVYSTDEIAREEFPDLDATIRSAVSIARRLQDPLAELVKIDPRSIGVGQYQHDVNVNKLKSSLEEVVESCVNKVGVNLNTSSYKLLGYVSGIGASLAKHVVEYRDKHGIFRTRQQLMEIPGFGPKTYEQAAGFLRVPESENPLDNSAVHPERYEIVGKIAADLQKPLNEIIGNKPLLEAIPWERYVTATIGLPTLLDISNEMIKPGRDPREDGTRLLFSDQVSELTDLQLGMILKGTVTNVTNFGAFVDIGVHQDGLIHTSELSEDFVKDPTSVISVGDVIDVKIIDVDLRRQRISLSRRLDAPIRTPGQPSYSPRNTERSHERGSERQQRFEGGRPDRNRDRGPDSRDHRDSRDGRGPRDSRDSRDNRDHRDHRDSRDMRSPRDSRDRDDRGHRDQSFKDQNHDQSRSHHQQRSNKQDRKPDKHYTMEDLLNKFGRKE